MKRLVLFLVLLSIPTNVLAYSSYIIPGGDNVGIELKYDGVMVVGFYNKLNDNKIKIGDYITKVNGVKVKSIDELINEVEKHKDDKEITLVVKRDNKIFEVKHKLVDSKIGFYVKDRINGIGTISYIDPNTNIYGALGHEIIDSESKSLIDSSNGSIYDSSVTSIDRSKDNEPGSKNASINKTIVKGDIDKNTNHGIFGTYTFDKTKELMEVGKSEDLKKGKAYIRTVTEKKEVKDYEINITKIDLKHNIKNIFFEITDANLLDKCGGVVQGMSGSPILQDGKIYGAVTHVVTKNPKNGYGVFITTMLEEGEK